MYSQRTNLVHHAVYAVLYNTATLMDYLLQFKQENGVVVTETMCFKLQIIISGLSPFVLYLGVVSFSYSWDKKTCFMLYAVHDTHARHLVGAEYLRVMKNLQTS